MEMNKQLLQTPKIIMFISLCEEQICISLFRGEDITFKVVSEAHQDFSNFYILLLTEPAKNYAATFELQ